MTEKRKYHVTLVRKTTRVIEIEEDSAEDARRQVEDYGILETFTDYDEVERAGSDEVKIKMVKRA